MSHPQALHTSCREGLGHQPGFQYNAASPSLDRTALSLLAGAHTGYHAPRDLPLEPGPDELSVFPVALKVSQVEGIGAVASRTVYVGREFRGRDGAPDEGRFGNYFSHIVVGAPGPEPFDGLLGIELWDAPHWRTEESASTELPELGELRPGGVDLAATLTALAQAPTGMAEALLQGALEALDGGPRVVLIEPEPGRAAQWIAWVTFALPAGLARRLTFTTFDGRPRHALDVHLCVTTPACDTAFAAHELDRAVRVIDLTARPPAVELSLYVRVVRELAALGPDTLADAVHALRDVDASIAGAALAVASGRTDLATAADAPGILDLLIAMTRAGDHDRAVAVARELPASALSAPALGDRWLQLHQTARMAEPSDGARDMAAVALGQLVPLIADLPSPLPALPPGVRTQPSVAGLAPWLALVEGGAATPAGGTSLAAGLRLGLLGVNAVVDRRVAVALVAGLGDPVVLAVLDEIARDPALEHVFIAVVEQLAERHGTDPRAAELLRKLVRHPAAMTALRDRARDGTFADQALYLTALVEQEPAQRPRAARHLIAAGAAADPGAHAAIRGLWGTAGPRGDEQHAELLECYTAEGRDVPGPVARAALAQLLAQPPVETTHTARLPSAIEEAGGGLRHAPAYQAWWALSHTPDAQLLGPWSTCAAVGLRASADEVPEARWDELLTATSYAVVNLRTSPDYDRAVARLLDAAPAAVRNAVIERLARGLKKHVDPVVLLASLFERWWAMPGHDLVETVLPEGARGRRRQFDEVGEALPAPLRDEWADWTVRHERPKRMEKVSRRLRGRGAADDPGAGQ